jgi:hypothetical protein
MFGSTVTLHAVKARAKTLETTRGINFRFIIFRISQTANRKQQTTNKLPVQNTARALPCDFAAGALRSTTTR